MGEDVEGSDRFVILRYCHSIFLEGLRITTKTLRIAGLCVEI
jgi:hypothetical protein